MTTWTSTPTNTSTWSGISTPQQTFTQTLGSPIGLLLVLTYATTATTIVGGAAIWSGVASPSTSWN